MWCLWWLLFWFFGEPSSVFLAHVHKALVIIAGCPGHSGVALFFFPAFLINASHSFSLFLTSSEVGRLLLFSVLIVIILSWFLRIMVMKSFDGVSGMFEVTGRVPDFVVFRRVTGPLGLGCEFVIVESRVDDFVEFVFVFSFYLNRRRWFLDLSGEFVPFVKLEE